MTSKISTRPQPTAYEQQVLKNVSDKLLELQTLEAQIETEKDLTTRVAEFALLLKKQAQPLIDLERALKDVTKTGDFNACKECHKRMWTKINRAIDPIASELQKATAGFIKDPKTPTLRLEQIIQKIEDLRTPISTYLQTGATSIDLVNAKELLDIYEAGLFDNSQKEQPKTITKAQPKTIIKEQPKVPAKEQPKAPLKDEVLPPDPQKVEQLIPGDEEVQPFGDELDWMLDDAAAREGMGYEQVKAPVPTVSNASSSSSSSSSSTTTTTTTSDTVIKPDTVSAPEKEFSATRRNTNPLAGEQICMQFISEFARFLRDSTQLILESIIQLGNEIYDTEKNGFPEKLHCLQKDNESPACVFEPKNVSYLKLLNDLEGNRKGFKGEAIPMIGAVLKFEGSSIAIVITQKNKQSQFHIFCPDGNVKLQEKADAFRKEFAKVEDAAEFLMQLHKSMKDAPITGTMRAFIRKQDFWLSNKMIKNGSGSSSSSSLSTTVSSSTSVSSPVPKPSINMPAHWHHEQTLQELPIKGIQ